MFLASAVAPSFVETEPAHEEAGKLEHLADHLSPSPFDYDALNLELLDELKLVDDSELQKRLETPVGALATADLFVSGRYGYLGSFADAVHIVDISQPNRLELVADVSKSGPAVDIKIEGDVAVVGVQKPGVQFGLLILDVSDPTDPQIAGEISHASWQGVHNLFLAQGRAYLAPTSDTEAVRGAS